MLNFYVRFFDFYREGWGNFKLVFVVIFNGLGTEHYFAEGGGQFPSPKKKKIRSIKNVEQKYCNREPWGKIKQYLMVIKFLLKLLPTPKKACTTYR